MGTYRKKGSVTRLLFLFISILLISQQLTIAPPEASALNVQPFTSPLSGAQEEINTIRSFLFHRVTLIRAEGRAPEKESLTLDDFPPPKPLRRQ